MTVDSRERAKLFWCLVAALLALMATLQFTSVRLESQTYDEGRQLLSGYTYLTTGHFTVAREHPPLLKLLWAIPVWFLHPSPPPEGDAWLAAVDFLYRNRIPADDMLLAGRCSAIAISVLLGFAIALWTRRHFGPSVALLAVLLYALDPNFLANGRYMKNDVGASLAIFAGTMCWGAYLFEPTRKRLLLAGLVLGLALTTKSSALILGPVFLLLYAIHRWQQRRPFDAKQCLQSLATVGVIAFCVIFAVYGFELEPAGKSWEFASPQPAAWISRLPVPALGYFRGVGNIALRQTRDSEVVGYLLGEESPTSWWYMTPVAFAVKTPLGELALFALSLCLAPGRLLSTRLRDAGFRWFLLTVPLICYSAAAVASPSNLGERHLLPLYPFLFVLAAAILLSTPVPKWRALATAAACLLLIVETASIHPHYLAFFNAFAGGPSGGRKYLVYSDLDWGQDARNLKAYMDAHHIPEVCSSYYGWVDLNYYRIPHRELPKIWDAKAASQLDCVAAISVTYLAVHRDEYAGLEQLTPDARIGYSIYLYDLRKRRDAPR